MEIIDQNKKLSCPRCSAVFNRRIMRKIEHPSGAVLDVCNRCGGMWLDESEVKLLYKHAQRKSASNKR